MYAYSEFDRAFVRDRVSQYRDQVKRRLNGSLTEDEFKPLRLMNGVYLQLHAYMLRVAIPYGSLTPMQMRQLADVADRWDKGYGHFTTRQNIQFNWPRLIDTPEILEALADVDMHAIQTSGNTIRNVTTDQFAGAALDEVADPRPYAELIRQWSTDHPSEVAFWTVSSVRPVMTTEMPSCNSDCAIPNPIPLVPPVTKAFFSFKCIIAWVFSPLGKYS